MGRESGFIFPIAATHVSVHTHVFTLTRCRFCWAVITGFTRQVDNAAKQPYLLYRNLTLIIGTTRRFLPYNQEEEQS